ncbi:MAG: penicillin acylase family protein [Deltaproteobacteria bacterium]|nr:penicillin acylase family protein [Deltaproteobacteria bacterium]
MKLISGQITLEGSDGPITLRRNQDGVPEITAATREDLAFGLGFIHMNDRQVQAQLTRILLEGRGCELLADTPELLAVDTFMRRFNFLPDPAAQEAALEPRAASQMRAYAAGVNHYFATNRPVWELRLLGYARPEPWTVADSLLIGKAFGFLGLVDAQGNLEKFLVQMIQHGVDQARLQELFPYLTEEIDYELLAKVKLDPPLISPETPWLAGLPRFSASNNWAVAGSRTASGQAILCGDPHLEVNRLPAVWAEIVMRLPDNVYLGVTIPGAPGLILGRNRRVAWSATYSFMDMLDFRVEHCAGGKYERKDGWRPFQVREEVIRRKKHPPLTLQVYENEHGVLEGDPTEEGYYLVQGWSAKENCGAGEWNGLLGLLDADNVQEVMACFRKLEASTFNFVIADQEGNLGYQMTGRLWQRPAGVSGLVPLPGWEERYDPLGFVDPADLPSSYNPPEGFIVTANQDLNHLGDSQPINLPMADYRARRIQEMLEQGGCLDLAYMKAMHYDLYSLQAERFLAILRPLLPDTPAGKLLKDWDCRYTADSRAATLFEAVYRALIDVVFGDGGLGREVVARVMEETSLFHDYYGNLDEVLCREDAAWFGDRPREELFRQALAQGLAAEPAPYGSTRKVMLSHLLLGGKLPPWLGFDYGPIELPGCRATIPQGQIFHSAGRLTTFSPSFRFVTDLGRAEIESVIAGGPRDRRWSGWYANDVPNWLGGRYKVLK